MPTVAKTSVGVIVRAARAIIVARGIAALSMETLAAAVGVRPPTLYGHFPSRLAILTEVATLVMHELETVGREALLSAKEDEPLLVIAQAQRRFAHASPHLYALVFGTKLASSAAFEAASRSAVQFVCEHVAAVRRAPGLAPEVLEGARLLTAFTHGFVSMELAGAFRLGGDIDQAFERGLAAIVGALRQP